MLFVLYFHPDCRVCKRVLLQLEEDPLEHVFIQNVQSLKSKPKWLNGVPILADLDKNLIYRGTDSLTMLTSLWSTKYQQNESTPPPQPTKPKLTITNTFDSLFDNDSDINNDHDDDDYTESNKQTKKFSQDALSELISMRAKQVPISKIEL